MLVDAGISCRETEKRINRLGLSMHQVKAIFISHEHGDHITGLPALSKKYDIPVYITPDTLAESRVPVEKHLINSFNPDETITIGGLSVTGFPKFHDATDPYSFVISSQSVKIGVFTDIGIACEKVIHHFKQCHAVFLEANYDEDMLENGRYPYHLKKRIRGGMGHLSNAQALRLFADHRPVFMSHLILSHLSKNNNDPKLVASLFEPYAHNTEIVVASRYTETALYHIHPNGSESGPTIKKTANQTGSQLSLFQL